MIHRLFFWLRYLQGKAPWDTGITPPEIVALIEDEKLPPGRAIDLGCGTGTTSIYLAQHGWQVVGIDFIPKPIRRARQKAQRAGVADRTRFIVGDVTKLQHLDLGEPFDLAIDIGCSHGLSPEARTAYARALGQIVRPGGLFMLYTFRPTPERPRGLEPEEVEALFAPEFRLTWSDLGEDSAAHAASAWYRFERVGSGDTET
ncbi:MAG TPA: class I SAM-dependent methyltransferase [Chloroflexi bacterium]|nr:class I SAM-dependent methyltransferase [Chloroflexota bacterium]